MIPVIYQTTVEQTEHKLKYDFFDFELSPSLSFSFFMIQHNFINYSKSFCRPPGYGSGVQGHFLLIWDTKFPFKLGQS